MRKREKGRCTHTESVDDISRQELCLLTIARCPRNHTPGLLLPQGTLAFALKLQRQRHSADPAPQHYLLRHCQLLGLLLVRYSFTGITTLKRLPDRTNFPHHPAACGLIPPRPWAPLALRSVPSMSVLLLVVLACLPAAPLSLVRGRVSFSFCLPFVPLVHEPFRPHFDPVARFLRYLGARLPLLPVGGNDELCKVLL